MRVKIIRWTDPTSSLVKLRVLRWCDSQWEQVRDFELNESEQANEFAMKLSMTKRIPVEMAVFEDGKKLSGESVSDQTYQYQPMPIPCDCSWETVAEALGRIGGVSKEVSSDLYVSDKRTPEAISKLRSDLQERNSLANRIRIDHRLKPNEWYVECAGTCVGSNPPW